MMQKRMRLRYSGVCRECSSELNAGVEALYERESRTVLCLDCSHSEPEAESAPSAEITEPIVHPEIASGVAGASAQREHDRRSANRETRIREKHPKIGGLILAMSDDPQSTKAWQAGAVGEVVVAKRLDSIDRPDVRVLHDRRIPKSRANIDHIVVCPTGVFVIDAKRYKDKRPSLRVEGGLFRPRVETLMIGSRDGSKLVAGVKGQVELVAAALEAAGLGDVHVGGMLCFVEAEWPLFGGDFEIEGLDVLWPKKAVERVNKPGPLDAAAVDRVHGLLAIFFAPA